MSAAIRDPSRRGGAGRDAGWAAGLEAVSGGGRSIPRMTLSAELADWLLDSDPSLRWQVLRDLLDAPAEEVAAERARVAREGWGGQLLALQDPDGHWDGGTYRPGWVDESRPMYDAWTATHFSLTSLREYGVDPTDPAVVRAVGLVRDNVRWEHDDEPYFDGETEACINGAALANAAYFGRGIPGLGGERIVATLLEDRRGDGGWNCWSDPVSSFHPTICVLEGLLEWELAGRDDPAVREARLAGEEYLLERRLLWRRSTGEMVDPRFGMLSWPVRWFYDVLRALEHFRRARPEGDPRLADAVAHLRAKADPDGCFRLENWHEGPIPFSLGREYEGMPSRAVTLGAQRLLRWADAIGL